MSRPVVANTLGPRGFFDHLSKNYKNEYWEFEKRLGFGAFGFTALFKRKGSPEQPAQRTAVKFAVGNDGRGATSLRDEIKMLEKVNGASHIVSAFASCSDLACARLAASGFSGNDNTGIPALAVFEGSVGLQGPAVALEYLEYGDIFGLMNKIRRTDLNVPNRVLWSFFCCFIRASVGLAYPAGKPLGSNAQILEELPPDHKPSTESGIMHLDFNNRNIMLTVDDGPEHKIGVKAKLIDFGLANGRLGRSGSPVNIFDAARTVATLATPRLGIPNNTCEYKGLPTKGVNLVGTGEAPFPLPWLDPELRDFLARCLYAEEAHRPGLQEALQVAENAVRSKTAMSFPEPDLETESAVDAFIQEFVFNVPP
ncbi:hypothetical protein O1611_g7859 [Lasiodiplodia mahajangana]|uniref:Uncharacterized protein n=1 Tax=Lasiodiplodia mahajangana TaxID=1108764 RepID=A0ACC2JE23_9PEZI|nr:hypothetical protein O1611_g7859 [Lasiodiplodia mahajangana]